jgi:hypothetical protein|tara:strand:+ start:88 stop:1215 length:1128 start_codon:yes stop_codon:yes gene_type:complete
MILEHKDALYAASYLGDYFSDFGRIDDYLRKIKLERMKKIPNMLFGMSHGDNMFSDFDMSPEDMDIEVRPAGANWKDLLEVTTSHAVEDNVPGRRLKLMIWENNTKRLLGFIFLGSCVLNLKPRNEWLEQPLQTTDADAMKRFNSAAMMGFIIVPVQPFGFNMLGGKLLASICCTHEIKAMFDAKYNSNICHFETTSLYGSTKSSSQYDGMKPYLRMKGLTDSNFTPLLNDGKYHKFSDWFTKKNDGVDLLEKGVSSRKLKMQTKMIGIIKQSLKKHSDNDYKNFCNTIEEAKGLTEQKRVYFSDYGFSNSKEYILGLDKELKKKDNYDSYSLENTVKWWKKKATKRWTNLKQDGRLRHELELWSENSDKIDIIR